MSQALAIYENEQHWILKPEGNVKVYWSVPTTVPDVWHSGLNERGQMVHTSGAYEIRRLYCNGSKRHYAVYRDGVELPLSYTALLYVAKARAVKNALGKDRMNVA